MSLDAEFGHWLAGFVDGEGCFYIARTNVNAPSGVTFRPGFQITLRDDDVAVLREIHATLGVGIMEWMGNRVGAPHISYRVNSKADCAEIVRVFERFPLRAKKARDFEVWKRAVRVRGAMRRGGRMQGRADWSEMERLYHELKGVRERVPTPDWRAA